MQEGRLGILTETSRRKSRWKSAKFFKGLLVFKVDEFLDFWQSTANVAALGLVQNALMYKLFFKLKQPNIKVKPKNTKSLIKHISKTLSG